MYETLWSDVSEVSVIFCQYVRDYVLKELAKIHFPLSETEEVVNHESLTYEERMTALRSRISTKILEEKASQVS